MPLAGAAGGTEVHVLLPVNVMGLNAAAYVVAAAEVLDISAQNIRSRMLVLRRNPRGGSMGRARDVLERPYTAGGGGVPSPPRPPPPSDPPFPPLLLQPWGWGGRGRISSLRGVAKPAKIWRGVTNNFTANSGAGEYSEFRHVRRCTRRREGTRIFLFAGRSGSVTGMHWKSPSRAYQEVSASFKIPGGGNYPLTPPPPRDALEGKGPWRWPQKRLDRRLEEVAKAVWGGYCRLQMPLKQGLGVRETVAGRRPGALEGGGGPPLPMHPCPPPPTHIHSIQLMSIP